MSAACRARPICSPFLEARERGEAFDRRGVRGAARRGGARGRRASRSRPGSTASATASRARSPIRSMSATGSPASAPRRATRLDKPPPTGAHRDIADHPDYAARLHAARGGTSWFAAAAVPCCTGPVAYRDRGPLELDLENLAAACAAAKPGEAFMNAASPGRPDQIRPRPLLPERRRLCRSPGRCAEGGIRGDPPGRVHPADRRAGPRVGPPQPVSASVRRRIPAHRRAQHRRAQPRHPEHPARGDAAAYLLGQLRGAAHPRHPARHGVRCLHAGAAAGAALRGRQSAPCP